MKFISYGGHHIDDDDIKAVSDALKSERITQGPLVEQFEQIVTKYCGASYGVAVNNGTTALFLAYVAIGLKQGDEVITTPLTFVATTSAFLQLGAIPVFVDIKKDTLNIDPSKIEEKITSKTKAIAVVDFAGHPCDLDAISSIAKKHNLFLIEDSAHALGSEYKGKKIGSIADLTTFSFHPVKLITTGEGGMILTDNQDLADKVKMLRHHGIVKCPEKGQWYQEVEVPGYNARLTDFQCALGISQFKKIDTFIKRIREIVSVYNDAFKNIDGVQTPFEAGDAKSAWHIYVLRIDWQKFKTTREKVFDFLKQKDIGSQVHYVPLYLHKYFQENFDYKKEDFPETEEYYKQAITLPLSPQMEDDDIERVINAIKEITQ